MLRINYEKNLNKLHLLIVEMGNLVVASIENSIKALIEKDEDLAEKVIVGDKDVNSLEDQIETLSFNLLLKEQPVASDLRFVTSAIKIITDMERIGDQAADIAYINVKLSHRSYKKEDLGSIIEMAEVAKSMVIDSIEGYISGDLDLINDVMERDDVVDDYFKKVRNEVVVDVKEDRFTTKNSLDMLMIAKYLERIGDHTVNIAERVYYSITGEVKKG